MFFPYNINNNILLSTIHADKLIEFPYLSPKNTYVQMHAPNLFVCSIFLPLAYVEVEKFASVKNSKSQIKNTRGYFIIRL